MENSTLVNTNVTTGAVFTPEENAQLANFLAYINERFYKTSKLYEDIKKNVTDVKKIDLSILHYNLRTLQLEFRLSEELNVADDVVIDYLKRNGLVYVERERIGKNIPRNAMMLAERSNVTLDFIRNFHNGRFIRIFNIENNNI